MLELHPRKAPYFPKVTLEWKQTRFGALEASHPNLYLTKGVEGRTVFQVDTYEALKSLIGSDIIDNDRERLYAIVSGNVNDSIYNEILVALYKRYPKFTNYVDSRFEFASEENLITAIIKPLRNAIDCEAERVFDIIKDSKGKTVMLTHDYLVAVLPGKREAVEGVITVCTV